MVRINDGTNFDLFLYHTHPVTDGTQCKKTPIELNQRPPQAEHHTFKRGPTIDILVHLKEVSGINSNHYGITHCTVLCKMRIIFW